MFLDEEGISKIFLGVYWPLYVGKYISQRAVRKNLKGTLTRVRSAAGFHFFMWILF